VNNYSGSRIMTQLGELNRFYALLEDLERRLGGARRLNNSDGRMNWPARGLYFFFEPGEHRNVSVSGPRVVRVGTHALKAGSRTSLWNRLSQHRGTTRTGGGNHRGSIFRMLVGSALIRREGWDCPSWGVASYVSQAAGLLGMPVEQLKSQELPIERRVSEYIGSMAFLWLAVGDEPGPTSRRGFLERNAIALLSYHSTPAIDSASDGWLGHWSDRDLVRRSGLWNNRHVKDDYDAKFIHELQAVISQNGEFR
jgi:hypothetical protein